MSFGRSEFRSLGVSLGVYGVLGFRSLGSSGLRSLGSLGFRSLGSLGFRGLLSLGFWVWGVWGSLGLYWFRV